MCGRVSGWDGVSGARGGKEGRKEGRAPVGPRRVRRGEVVVPCECVARAAECVRVWRAALDDAEDLLGWGGYASRVGEGKKKGEDGRTSASGVPASAAVRTLPWNACGMSAARSAAERAAAACSRRRVSCIDVDIACGGRAGSCAVVRRGGIRECA